MTSKRLYQAGGAQSDLLSRVGLVVLVMFTALAIGGYWFFGLHPENLARFPSSASFYAVSYSFFAQTQVWLSGAVLAMFLVRSAGWRWVLGFALVYVLSLSSELIGTTTGFPFGDYRYTTLLGTKWFDHVPVVIPLSWFTMVLPAHIISGRLIEWSLVRPAHWLLTGILLTIWDLALDPAMSHLVVYWQWGVEGSYYGMPWVNLAGWLLTGTVLSFALDKSGVREWEEKLSSRWLLLYYVTLFALPFGMLIAAGAWPAALLSTGVLIIALELYGRLGSGSAPGSISGREGSSGRFPPEIDSGTMDDNSYLTAVITAASHDAWTFFRSHSRSFSFSSRLFNKNDRHRVTSLYVFCRITDDLADEGTLPADRKAALLEEWRDMVRLAYEGEPSGLTWLDELGRSLHASGLPFDVIDTLIDGVLRDIGKVRIQTVQELKEYSYSVASTVGIMMCHLFGETDNWKLSRAAALGRAMQITNILRDVRADLAMDRVYLPAGILALQGLHADDLEQLVNADWNDAQRDSRMAAYISVIHDLEQLAESEYMRAWEAIPRLPARFGLPVAVAAEIYRGILRNLRNRGYDNLSGRIVTGATEKMWSALRGLVRYGYGCLQPGYAIRTSPSADAHYREHRS